MTNSTINFTPSELLELEYNSTVVNFEGASRELREFSKQYLATKWHLESDGRWEPIFNYTAHSVASPETVKGVTVAWDNQMASNDIADSREFEEKVEGEFALMEMYDDMDAFEAEVARDKILSTPHEHRAMVDVMSCVGVIDVEDQITMDAEVTHVGEKYWTGVSKIGKIFIPLTLTNFLSGVGDSHKITMKFMGPSFPIPWRAYFVHKK